MLYQINIRKKIILSMAISSQKVLKTYSKTSNLRYTHQSRLISLIKSRQSYPIITKSHKMQSKIANALSKLICRGDIKYKLILLMKCQLNLTSMCLANCWAKKIRLLRRLFLMAKRVTKRRVKWRIASSIKLILNRQIISCFYRTSKVLHIFHHFLNP